jgi:D-arabinitol 4-dehydrogenase
MSDVITTGHNVILHLGLGSFHRAHQAMYLDALRREGDRAWSIAAGNLRDDMADTVGALRAQHGEYTLETVSPAGERRYQRVGSIREVVPYTPDLRRLIEIGADPATRIVSFTVTEAGYYLDPHDRLDLAHADLRADVEQGSSHTLYGALAKMLARRRVNGGAPLTLLSCDNLRSNGTRFRAGMLDFLGRRGERDLRAWVEKSTTSPCNMVDRITPRPLPEVVDRVREATGWHDQAPVMGESFVQWVIEDRFIAGRPDWGRVGVELVERVHAYEEAKIRVLNATHSCVAWAGSLIGKRFIHEDMKVPAIREIARAYVTDDVIPCLDTVEHPCPIDLAVYRDVVLERFANPFIADTNQRVAMDGFSKIPGFIVPTLHECMQRGAPIESTAMLPAVFFAYLARWHRGELDHTYQDGVMEPAVAHAFFASADPLASFLRDPLLWGQLAGDQVVGAAVRRAHERVEAFVAAH